MSLILGQETTIETPETGYGNLGTETDKYLHFVDEDGVDTQLSFGGATSLTGSRADTEAALANLITILADRGIVIDNTTT